MASSREQKKFFRRASRGILRMDTWYRENFLARAATWCALWVVAVVGRGRPSVGHREDRGHRRPRAVGWWRSAIGRPPARSVIEILDPADLPRGGRLSKYSQPPLSGGMAGRLSNYYFWGGYSQYGGCVAKCYTPTRWGSFRAAPARPPGFELHPRPESLPKAPVASRPPPLIAAASHTVTGRREPSGGVTEGHLTYVKPTDLPGLPQPYNAPPPPPF